MIRAGKRSRREGFILLQFVIEHGRKAKGLGLDVGDLTQAIFKRLGMHRTSLVWKVDNPETNVADGWNDQGRPQPHDKRSKVRPAGSGEPGEPKFEEPDTAALSRINLWNAAGPPPAWG